MRQKRSKPERQERNRVSPAPRETTVTNEEILGDLLYPASPSRVGATSHKSDR